MNLSSRFLAGAALAALYLPAANTPVWAQTQIAANGVETVIVTGERTEAQLPNKIYNVDADVADVQINAVNTEDMMKYVPSITVRKRHYGDTQDPLATRTSGVGASARSLLFVDGILISSPIGNNNTYASPHFGIAQPEDVSNFQVLYGPFAAEYAGGSIGAVLNITTRMPQQFTLYASALGAVQSFQLYGTKDTYGTWQLSGGIGDKLGNFSWRLSANHLDSIGQPLGLVTLTRPASTSNSGTVVTGGVNDFLRTGAPSVDIGASGIEKQVQDTDTVKLAYDFDNGWEATYTASVFHQSDDAGAQTWLRDASGTPVYTGNTNINGYNYTIAASSFSNGVYDWNQTHLAQAVTLKSGTEGEFAWEAVASAYFYLDDKQRVPTAALPGALTASGAGTLNRLNGTGWYTLDAKGIWRGWTDNEVSFGLHRDQETFSQTKYNLADWIAGAPTSLATNQQGRTATDALWLQDIWSILPELKATLGLRAEQWHAYDGLNFSASPALNVTQPPRHTSAVSPKASLAWMPDEDWTLSASYGRAFRMPTVTELYQAITTGTTLTSPNPNLRPERANSYELAGEYRTDDANLRLSLFREEISDALLSQSTLVPGTTTITSFVQNVDLVRSNGIELVAEKKNAFGVPLDLQGSLTYVIGKTAKDAAFPAAVGKFIPQLPKLRGEWSATWHATDALALTAAARYSDRSYGTIDNSDPYSHTYQGFDGYFVADIRAHYQWDDNWSISAGVDNINNTKYFLFHPFPQRTFVMEIHYAQ
jgi:iron complex outermembrane receptor protein